jgi:hypothetical protein
MGSLTGTPREMKSWNTRWRRARLVQVVRRGSTLERVLGMAKVPSGRVTEATKAASMPSSSAALATWAIGEEQEE